MASFFGYRSRARFGRSALRLLVLAWTWAVGSVAFAIPSGFVEERLGEDLWLYPVAAQPQVRELQSWTVRAWREVTGELGLAGPSRLTIRVGRNPEEMQSLATREGRLPDYASGVAIPERSLVFLTLTAPETWQLVDLPSVLKHELSHVALHRAAGGHPIPRWFSEGLAIDQAEEHSLERIRTLWEGTVSGQLIPLTALSRAFPAHHHEVSLAYAQSADFVRYLKRGPHGQLRMARVIAAVAKGASFDAAMEDHFRAPLATLEREWREQLGLRFSQWPLLLSGLTGLWFALSLLLVLAYVRTRRRHHETLARWEAEEAALDAAVEPETSLHERSPSMPPPVPADAQRPPPLFTPDGVEVPRIHHDPSGIPTIHYGGENHTLH